MQITDRGTDRLYSVSGKLLFCIEIQSKKLKQAGREEQAEFLIKTTVLFSFKILKVIKAHL